MRPSPDVFLDQEGFTVIGPGALALTVRPLRVEAPGITLMMLADFAAYLIERHRVAIALRAARLMHVIPHVRLCASGICPIVVGIGAKFPFIRMRLIVIGPGVFAIGSLARTSENNSLGFYCCCCCHWSFPPFSCFQLSHAQPLS